MKNTTNEEKAREIAIENSSLYEFGFNYDSSFECYNSAMEMAQFMIDKACKWLKDNIKNYYYLANGVEYFDEMIEDIKEAMEE